MQDYYNEESGAGIMQLTFDLGKTVSSTGRMRLRADPYMFPLPLQTELDSSVMSGDKSIDNFREQI